MDRRVGSDFSRPTQGKSCMKEYKTLSFMLDCSRNAVPNMEFLKGFIDILSDLGYNELQLYMEDLYEIEGEPYFGYLRGKYNKSEIEEIDRYCITKGIELVPCIQTLAHLGRIFRWGKYASIHDFGDVLLADQDETYAFLEKEFLSISQMFSSRKINLGMDETHCLGLGQHLKKYGYENPQDIFFRHVGKVYEIARKYGFQPMMWSDMFLKFDNNGEYYHRKPLITQSAIEKVPDGITLVYWDYNKRDKRIYQGMLDAHKQLVGENLRWAAACWSFIGFIPHNDYSLAAQKAAIPVMKKNGVQNYMLTFWGDDGAECSKNALLPAVFQFSEMVKGNFNFKDIQAKFEQYFGVSWSDFLTIDLPNQVDKQPLDVYCPSKYMLYNDYFLGIFDVTVDMDARIGDKYRKYARRLYKVAKNKKYGYLFLTAAKLCKVLEWKYELGIKTRQAYRTKDYTGMQQLIKSYVSLEKRIQEFYDAFKAQWYQENKGYGFEVQAARIGGLLQRTKDCRERLFEWVQGKIGRIEELEEEINLDIYGRGEKKEYLKKAVVCNVYAQCITTSNV